MICEWLFPMSVKLEEVVIKLDFHLRHGFFDAFRLELAFSDDDHLPAVVVQHLIVLLVTFLVSSDFGNPKLPICFRNLATC